MKESHYFYFELSLQYITKSKPLLFIIFFIEYYDTFLHLCEASIYLRNSDLEIEELILRKNKVNIISPLNYLRDVIKQEENTNWAFLILALILLYYFFIKAFILFGKPFTLPSSNRIIVNVLDLLISRLFAFCIIDLIIFWTFLLISQNNTLLSFIFFLLTIITCGIYFNHIKLYYVFSTGHYDYPFTKATMKYDLFLFAMKMISSFNKNALEVLKENDQVVYFLNIALILYAFSGFTFFAFFFFHAPCFFIYNQILIKEKAFFIIGFTLVSFAFLMINEHSTLFIILLVSIACFSFIITNSIDPIQRCYTQIGRNDHLENQLLFIFNLSRLPQCYETKYDEEIKRHYMFCKQCPLCSMLKKTESMFEREKLDTYHHLFLNLLTQSIHKFYSKVNVLYFDVFDILTKVRNEDCFNYKLQLKFRQLIRKYSRTNTHVSMNLRYIHSIHCKEMKIPELNQYRLISLFDSIVDQTKEVVNYIKKIFMDNITTPNEIMKLAVLIEHIDRRQQKILNNRENMQNYPIVLLRIANEELLNTPINKDEGLMRIEKNYSEDFLNFHYTENRIMIISVDKAKKCYIITRTGNDLIQYLNEDFAQLFPKEYREYSMSVFNALVSDHHQNNKESFEFIIQTDIEMENYALFKYSFALTPGLKSADFCIIGEYHVGLNDIIISTKKNSDSNSNNSSYVLSWVNSNISPIIFGTNHNSNQKQRIIRKAVVFSDVFIKSTTSSVDIFIFKKNEMELRLTLCFDFMHKENKYQVYLVKAKDLSKKNNGDDTNSINETENSNEMNKYQTIDDNKSVFWLDDSSSVNTTSTKSNLTSKAMKSRGRTQKYSKQTQSKLYLNRFRKTSNLILLFCVLLICYMLVTLFIELDLNNSIVKLYNIYTNFRAANRLYYTMVSNIIGVICVGETNGNNCVRYYELYTRNLMETTDIKLNIFNYIVLENQEKIIEFGERIKLLKLNIHELNDEFCSNAYNQDFNYSLLSNLNAELYLRNQTTTFSNALEILVNSMMAIILDPNSTSIPIYAYSTDPYDFSHIYNRESLSRTQFEYYNSFINYRSYLLTWNSIQQSLYSKIIERLNNFRILSNVFMVITYCFHLLLCGLLFFYLNSFLNLLIFQLDKIISKMNRIENKRFYLTKLDLILGMCKLYEDNPLTVMKKIDTLYYDYFKQRKLNKLFETNIEANEKKAQHYFKTFVYVDLLKNYFYFVLIVLLYYTLLFFIFVLIRNLTIKETILVVNIIEEVSYGDSAGFNGLTLIQLMFIANLTESSIGRTLNYEGDDYFAHTLSSAIDIYYSYVEQQKKTDLVMLSGNLINLQCSSFYYEIDDIIINSIEAKYPEMNIKRELATVCESHNFLSYFDAMVIIKALFYNLLQISKIIKRAPFDVYLDVIAKSKLFEIFNTVFLFFQPLRTWMNTKVFDTAIEKITNEETVILIIYLVINNITELVLLMLLYFFLIKHITKMNKNINRVICVFKIKQEKS